MSRLTKKFNGEYYHREANTIMFDSEADYNVVQKLGKLEDLEQELGCSLEVVFKGMSDDNIVEYKIRDETVVGSISSIYKSIGNKWFGNFIPKKYIVGTL